MEIEVVSVQDAGFDGSDGPVAGAALTYKFNGEEKSLRCYGQNAPTVLNWEEGSKHDIELYTTKSGKPSFRLPQAGGFGGGGFHGGGGGGKKFEPAYRNTEAGQKNEQAHMDARTALMQAVAALGPPSRENDIGMAALYMKTLLGVANQMYDWLRSKNGG